MTTNITLSKNAVLLFIAIVGIFFIPGLFTQAEAGTCGYSWSEVPIFSPSPPPPSCEFSVSDQSIAKGESTVLSWTTNMGPWYQKEMVFIEPGICDVSDSGSLTVSPSETTTYKLYAVGVHTGANVPGHFRSAKCQVTVTVEEPVCSAPSPEAEISYTGDEFVGGYSSWEWSWENKESHTADVRAYGCDNPDSNFNWTAWNPAGGLDAGSDGPWLLDSSHAGCTYEIEYTVENECGVIDSDVVQVTFPSIVEPEPPTCDSFTASPESRTGAGDITLEWETTNATEVSISGITETLPVDGSKTVYVSSDTTWTLTAKNVDGEEITCTASVDIIPQTCEAPSPVANISYTGDTFIGGYSSWEWSWENKDSHTALVKKYGCDDGSSADWTDWNPAGGLDAGSDGPWLLDSSHAGCTYEIEYTVANSCDVTDTDLAQVTFDSIVSNPAICDSFTASPESRTGAGDITLEWETTNAVEVSISGITETLPVDGTKTLYVSSDTTWTLTAKNVDGEEITCPASVDIRSGGGGGSRSPRCDLDISDTKIASGEKVTLSWDNRNTSDILLKDSHGKTLINTKKNDDDDDKYDEDEDSIRVSPTRTTTYTLTAIRGSKDRDCSVKVTVEKGEVAGISFTGTRYQDVISLATTPYTGFEAGKVLTVIFYLAIVLWAAAIAYALVMKKKQSTVLASEVSVPTFVPTFEPEVQDTVPENIPTDPELVWKDEMALSDDNLKTLEDHAHSNYVLISSDGLKYIESLGGDSESQLANLDRIIGDARGKYPKEGDWLVLNKERILSLRSE